MTLWEAKSRDATEVRSEKINDHGESDVFLYPTVSIEMQFYLNDVYYTRNLINIFISFLNSIFLQFGSQTCRKNQLKLLICFLPRIDNAKNTCTFGLIIINFGRQYWAENKIWIVFPLALRTQPPFF